MPETKYAREYGKGTFLGDNGVDFFNKTLTEQVLEMGWSHACPIIDQVAREYTPEWTLRRYAECNFVFGLITESAKDLNPKLYKQLTSDVDRLSNEPAGISTSEFTPKDFDVKMSPLSTPWGYALPRVVIEEMGRGENNKDRTPERMLKALDLIDQVVKKSKNPIELVVKLSENVCKNEADPKAVLSHLFASGILLEENCRTMFREIFKEMKRSAPILTKEYESLRKNDLTEFISLGIITPDKLDQ